MERSPHFGDTHLAHRLVTLTLISAGILGFWLLMAAMASAALAEDSLVSSGSTSVTTDSVSTDSLVGTADATVSTDGATLSTDSSAGTADATVSTDGATLSTDSPAGTADATVSTDGATLSTDSPMGPSMAQPVVDQPLAAGDALPSPGVNPEADSTSTVSTASAVTFRSFGALGPESPIAHVDGWFGMDEAIRGLSQPAGPHPGLPAGGPLLPDASAGMAPSPTSSGGPGADAVLAWVLMILLLGFLWNLLSERSRLPRGNVDLLALPG
jgi:hypothetical protein